jgi:Domain of unknown function (DUF4129)
MAAGAGGGTGGGAAVTRQEGHQLARTELSKAIYHPGVPITERIEHAIERFLTGVGVAVPVGWWAIVALAALLVIALAAVLAWIGPVRRSRSRAMDSLLSSGQPSAHDHRQKAERMAAAGDYATAIIESVRAIAVELEERGVLEPRVGRTADEFAAEAGQPLPGHATGLMAAARLFNDVRYGERAGTAAGYQRVRELDVAIRAARPAVSAAPSLAASAPASSTAGPVA